MRNVRQQPPEPVLHNSGAVSFRQGREDRVGHVQLLLREGGGPAIGNEDAKLAKCIEVGPPWEKIQLQLLCILINALVSAPSGYGRLDDRSHRGVGPYTMYPILEADTFRADKVACAWHIGVAGMKGIATCRICNGCIEIVLEEGREARFPRPGSNLGKERVPFFGFKGIIREPQP